MVIRPGVWACAVAMFALAVAACGGGAAPTSVPTASISPTSAPVASAAPTEAVVPAESPAPSTSAIPRPSIDQAQLDAFLTSSITLIDLADDDLAVIVSYVDPSSDKPFDLGTYTLASTEQMTNQVPPGTYLLEFRQPADSTSGSTCTIEISDTDSYVFAAINGAIAINRTGATPTDARELFVATSTLCGK
jgi:hypothetical protein